MLRNEIEKIQNQNSCKQGLCDKYKLHCYQCHTDRICEAIGKAAKGMPKNGDEKDGTILWCNTPEEMREECQAYWQGQIKE